MIVLNTIFSFISSFLLVFFMPACAYSFQAEVLPSEIHPGDAFVIQVKGAAHKLPSASFKRKQLYFSSYGQDCFLAFGAVDIRTKPGIYTIKLKVGEKKTNLKFVVKHTTFPTIKLTLPEEKVFLSPENLERVKEERKKLKSIWKTVSDKLWEGRFSIPLGNDISTGFGTKRIINKEKISIHRGVDIRGAKGETIKASNNGRVVLTEELFFGGNTVILDHGQGIYTIYMHLSKFNVKPEDIVTNGDIIGFVGSSGRATGPHLHFGVKVMDISTNPVSFMKLDL